MIDADAGPVLHLAGLTADVLKALHALDNALQGLLDVAPAHGSGPVAAPPTAPMLTRREREVTGLVAEGLTNQEIADRLVISTRTAEAHVEHVLRKLDFRSRTQIATWFATAAG